MIGYLLQSMHHLIGCRIRFIIGHLGCIIGYVLEHRISYLTQHLMGYIMESNRVSTSIHPASNTLYNKLSNRTPHRVYNGI